MTSLTTRVDGKEVFFNQSVCLMPYSEEWPLRFEKEKSALIAIFGTDRPIEHFGSTSIPGIGLAKPIIDIKIAVGEGGLPISTELEESLHALGYLFHSNPDIPEEEYQRFNKGNPIVDTCLHLETAFQVDRGSLVTRDYLRTHPEAVHRYVAAKQTFLDASATKPLSMIEYRTAKTAVLREIAQEATEWHLAGRP